MFSLKIKRSLIAFIALFITVTPCLYGADKTASQPRAKYIFLMIGDGMGVEQRAAAEMYKRLSVKAAPDAIEGKLIMNRLPVHGLTVTNSVGGKTTDSAAAATALACGAKTKNGMLGMTPDKEKLKSIAYFAKEAGMKVGIISSVPLNHATPAGFYSNEAKRGDYYNIAIQLPVSGFNYFAGAPFLGKSKGDQPSPTEVATTAGYTAYSDGDGLDKINHGDDKILWQAGIPWAINCKPGQATLADFTRKGIEVLDNPDGFFMMVEGGMVDWTGHSNEFPANVRQTLFFDDAVAVAMDFYNKHPDETLIVVTADHETGGLKTDFGETFSPAMYMQTIAAQDGSRGEFSNIAKKWNSESTTTEDAYQAAIDFFGLTNLSEEDAADLRQKVDYAVTGNVEGLSPEDVARLDDKKNSVTMTCKKLVEKRCNVTWSTGGHTPQPVATTAIGPGSEQFGGEIDNTDIAKRLAAIIEARLPEAARHKVPAPKAQVEKASGS